MASILAKSHQPKAPLSWKDLIRKVLTITLGWFGNVFYALFVPTKQISPPHWVNGPLAYLKDDDGRFIFLYQWNICMFGKVIHTAPMPTSMVTSMPLIMPLILSLIKTNFLLMLFPLMQPPSMKGGLLLCFSFCYFPPSFRVSSSNPMRILHQSSSPWTTLATALWSH